MDSTDKPFFPSHSVELPPENGKQPVPVVPAPAEETDMLSKIASVISWILCPLLMPVYGMFLIFSLSILSYATSSTKFNFVLTVAVVNAVLPMLVVFVLKAFGVVRDVALNERNERSVPYVVTAACLAATAIFLDFKRAPEWVAMFFMGGAVAAVINLVVNLKWKISAHAAGIAGLVAMLIRLAQVGMPQHPVIGWIVSVILLAGVLGSCRIYLRRHTVMQVLAGYVCGFFSVYLLSILK